MAHQDSLSEHWEQAFWRQSHDAAVGRLFRGLIHNLNGHLQVFALQTDLLDLGRERIVEVLAALRATALPPQAVQFVDQLQDLLVRRGGAVDQLRQQLRQCEASVRRTLVLPDLQQPVAGGSYTLAQVVETELFFLAADPFFKHKVDKELRLGDQPVLVSQNQLLLHQVLFQLLANSVIALSGASSPRLTVTASQDQETVELVVEDNGCGIAPEAAGRIFEPFFSTWPGHQGLGLYLARRMVADQGGTLLCEQRRDGACFRLRLPLRALGAGPAPARNGGGEA